MKSKIEILTLLSTTKNELISLGVSSIGLFGSVVRDEQKEDSDIDILIDFESEKETFSNYIKACEIIENLFAENKVDIVSEKGLSPFISSYIKNEVIYA